MYEPHDHEQHDIDARTANRHVRDMSRRADGLPLCSCGHVTGTITEMTAHVADENGRQARGGKASAAGPVQRTEPVTDPWGTRLPVPER